jgi:hypothetical protein
MTIKANAREFDEECTKFVNSFNSLSKLKPMYKAMISVGRIDEAWVWFNTNKNKYSDQT